MQREIKKRWKNLLSTMGKVKGEGEEEKSIQWDQKGLTYESGFVSDSIALIVAE